MITGGVPSFSDVLFNMDKVSRDGSFQDNIVDGFGRLGRKIVFYGDDTWVKLFPDTFVRSEGTHSFFIEDYTEVIFR